MNFSNILEDIEKADPEVYEKLDSRRSAMKNFLRFTGKASLATLPLAVGGMFKKAYAGTTGTSTITDVLNFALTLEYIEWEFYIQAVASGIIPNSTDLAALTTIRDHEAKHVAFLTTVITSLGATPVSFTAASFDYTAHGTFPTVFTDYGVMLAVAQTFEDTGVRAYKGQAGNLMSSNEILRAALRIHSVEARHAAHLREMRRRNGLLVPAGTLLQPWITLNQSGIASAAVQASYNGEELTTQAGINIVNINGFAIAATEASEAFDEPLTKEEVVAIVTPFFA
ncbi:MAG: ferritin-like domain-containing protein [Ginsengibacter sp.]